MNDYPSWLATCYGSYQVLTGQPPPLHTHTHIPTHIYRHSKLMQTIQFQPTLSLITLSVCGLLQTALLSKAHFNCWWSVSVQKCTVGGSRLPGFIDFYDRGKGSNSWDVLQMHTIQTERGIGEFTLPTTHDDIIRTQDASAKPHWA